MDVNKKAKQVLPFFGLRDEHWNKYRGLSTSVLPALGRDDVGLKLARAKTD